MGRWRSTPGRFSMRRRILRLRRCSLSVDSGVHSKASVAWNSEDVKLPPLFQNHRGFSSFFRRFGPSGPIYHAWFRSSRTFRPVVRGTQYAVSSMKQEATRAAARILESGGNAFDAIVAGQAVLALVNPESNGLGADAVILVYHAGEKQVYSINAEGTAPKLATIDWYNKNNGGKIPNSDGLLSASLPGVIDAWYVLLDRWGTMTFAQVLEQAIDVAENGFPIGDGLARAIAGSRKIQKYPTSKKVYFPNGKAPHPGDIFRNVDSARMLRKLVEAEQAAAGQGRREALRAARDRFYKGDIAKTMGEFSEQNGGLYRYEDFAAYTAKVETPVSVNYRGYEVYKNPSSSQGPAELFLLNILEGYDVKKLGHNSSEYIHTSAEALKLAFADREKLGDTDFVRSPLRGSALQGLRGRASQAHRSQSGFARNPARQSRAVHESGGSTCPHRTHARGQGCRIKIAMPGSLGRLDFVQRCDGTEASIRTSRRSDRWHPTGRPHSSSTSRTSTTRASSGPASTP